MFIRVQLRYPPLPMQILPASRQKSLLMSRWETNPTYPLPSTPSTPDTSIPSLVVRKRCRLDMDALLLQRGSGESLDPWRCSMLTHHTMPWPCLSSIKPEPRHPVKIILRTVATNQEFPWRGSNSLTVLILRPTNKEWQLPNSKDDLKL